MQKFNITAFVNGFNITLNALKESERITKDALRSLSRDLLLQLHTIEDNPRCGDIGFTNQVVAVLTPMNRKTMVLFMQEFSGFLYNEKEEQFTKKDKGAYADKFVKAGEFLEDPMNNIWSWAERNVKVEKKMFKLDTLTKDIKKALEAKNDEGMLVYDKADVIKAIMAGGLDVKAIVEIMEQMAE